MTDPFESLRAPHEPQQPRPSFSRALRARLVEALDIPETPDVPTVELPPWTSGPSWCHLAAAEADIVVTNPDTPTQVEHSQLRWPEGGIIQAGSANRGTPYSDRPTGAESIYVVTADPAVVYERALAAGAEIIEPLHEVDYAEGTIFTCRDPEGNIWSFGTYGGES